MRVPDGVWRSVVGRLASKGAGYHGPLSLASRQNKDGSTSCSGCGETGFEPIRLDRDVIRCVTCNRTYSARIPVDIDVNIGALSSKPNSAIGRNTP